MGPALCENDGFAFLVQLPVGGVSVTDNGASESFQEFLRIICFPGFLVCIQDNGGIPISLACPVDTHVTLTVCLIPLFRYFDRKLIGMQHMETVHPFMKVIIKSSQIPVRTLDYPVCHYLPGDVDVISQKLLADPV